MSGKCVTWIAVGLSALSLVMVSAPGAMATARTASTPHTSTATHAQTHNPVSTKRSRGHAAPRTAGTRPGASRHQSKAVAAKHRAAKHRAAVKRARASARHRSRLTTRATLHRTAHRAGHAKTHVAVHKAVHKAVHRAARPVLKPQTAAQVAASQAIRSRAIYYARGIGLASDLRGVLPSLYQGKWYVRSVESTRMCIIRRESHAWYTSGHGPYRGAYQMSKSLAAGAIRAMAPEVAAELGPQGTTILKSLKAKPINAWNRYWQDRAFWTIWRKGAGAHNWGGSCHG